MGNSNEKIKSNTLVEVVEKKNINVFIILQNEIEMKHLEENIKSQCQINITCTSDIKKLEDFLNKITKKNKKIILITNASLYRQLGDKISFNPIISRVIIFCWEVEKHIHWAKKVPKIVCISKNFSEILEESIFQCCLIYKEKYRIGSESLGNLNIGKFFIQNKKRYSQLYLLLNCLENNICISQSLNDDKESIKYEKNCIEKEYEFLKELETEKILYIYKTKDYIFQIFNHSLVSCDFSNIFFLRFFLYKLYSFFKEFNFKNKITYEEIPKQVYRADVFSSTFLNDLELKKDKLLYCQTFTTAYLDRYHALDFIRGNLNERKKEKVIFIIKITEENIKKNLIIKQNINKINNDFRNLEEFLIKNNIFFKIVEYTNSENLHEITLEILNESEIIKYLDKDITNNLFEYSLLKNSFSNDILMFMYFMYKIENYEECLKFLENVDYEVENKYSYFIHELKGKVLFKLNRHEEAYKSFEKAMNLSIRKSGENFENSFIIENNMAICLFNNNKLNESLNILKNLKKKLEKSLPLDDEIYDKNDSNRPYKNYSNVNFNIGNVKFIESKYKESVEFYEDSLRKIKKDKFCLASDLIYKIYFNIASSFLNQGKYEDSICHYQKSYDNLKILNPDSKFLPSIIAMQAVCYRRLGKFKELKNKLLRVLEDLKTSKSKNKNSFIELVEDIILCIIE